MLKTDLEKLINVDIEREVVKNMRQQMFDEIAKSITPEAIRKFENKEKIAKLRKVL